MRAILRLPTTVAIFCFSVSAQRLVVETNSIPGIQVITPDSSEFQILLRQIVAEESNRNILSPVLPSSFIIRNTGYREILEITTQTGEGPTGVGISATLRGRLRPNGVELWLPAGPLARWFHRKEGMTDYHKATADAIKLGGMSVRRVSIDSVFYEDRELAGPDARGVFQRAVASDSDFREVIQKIESMRGASDEAVMAWLRGVVAEPPRRPARYGLANILLAALERAGRARMYDVAAQEVANHARTNPVWTQAQSSRGRTQ